MKNLTPGETIAAVAFYLLFNLAWIAAVVAVIALVIKAVI